MGNNAWNVIFSSTQLLVTGPPLGSWATSLPPGIDDCLGKGPNVSCLFQELPETCKVIYFPCLSSLLPSFRPDVSVWNFWSFREPPSRMEYFSSEETATQYFDMFIGDNILLVEISYLSVCVMVYAGHWWLFPCTKLMWSHSAPAFEIKIQPTTLE